MSLKYKLPPGYEIREIPDAQFWDLWTRPAKKIFNDVSMFYRNAEVFTKQELAQQSKLRKEFPQTFKLNLGTMVLLSYFKNKTQYDILDFRSGFRKPNKKMKKIFSI